MSCPLVLPSTTVFSDGLIASLVQSILAVAQRNFRSLECVPVEDIVILSIILDYPGQHQVELSKEIWQSQRVVPVPERSSNATRTGFFRTRPAGVRKPVICPYPPSSLPDVTVALSLASSWSFSAVYPNRRQPRRLVNTKRRNPSPG